MKNWKEQTPAGIELVAHDHMPREVAIEMLCEPRARLTSRQRKNCRLALETHYHSTRQRKPIDVRVPRKLQTNSWEQLARWLPRAQNRRKDFQAKFQGAQRQQVKLSAQTKMKDELGQIQFQLASLERAKQVLNFKVEVLDQFIDFLEQEVKRRQELINTVQTVKELNRIRREFIFGEPVTATEIQAINNWPILSEDEYIRV